MTDVQLFGDRRRPSTRPSRRRPLPGRRARTHPWHLGDQLRLYGTGVSRARTEYGLLSAVSAWALQPMPLEEALEHVNVPSYVIDATGVIRWVNPAAQGLVGDVRGRQFTSVVAPEDTRRARELFARKIVGGARVTNAGVVLIDAGGDRIAVELSSVPLYRGRHVIGVFGQVAGLVEEPHEHRELHLTPRQAEVLELLERGRSTKQIAVELHLSAETVRNHVRHLLRAVGAHSRLEAVAIASNAN